LETLEWIFLGKKQKKLAKMRKNPILTCLCRERSEDKYAALSAGDKIYGSLTMARECFFLGKKTSTGRSIARRGKAKYLGGVGKKVTGITKRKFKPNTQKVRAVVDGKVCRIVVSAKAIRQGLVVKPAKRKYQPAEQSVK